jgi:ribosomal protein L40E
MTVREALWDCQYCGTTGILGRYKTCPNCGRSRPEGTRFYLPEDAAAVTDEKLVTQAKVGPDWICAFCGTSNPATAEVCRSCGATREATSALQKVADYKPGEAPDSGDMAIEDVHEKYRQPEAAPKRRALPLAAILWIAAFAMVCLGLLGFLIFGGRDVEATVSGFQWQRTVEVEAYQTVTEEDWTVPEGGRLVNQRQEIHHYDQILIGTESRQRQVNEQVQVGVRTYVCGQRDLGNGFFEDIQCSEPVYENQTRIETYEEPIYRQEPVYQTRYTYEIDKWVVVRTDSASGSDHQPYWPRAALGSSEREGNRTESYVIFFESNRGETYPWEIPFDRWLGYETGQKVELELSSLGKLEDVKP